MFHKNVDLLKANEMATEKCEMKPEELLWPKKCAMMPMESLLMVGRDAAYRTSSLGNLIGFDDRRCKTEELEMCGLVYWI